MIIYPGLAVGGLMFTTLVALLCFRDRLRPAQWWGLGVGAVALVLLNMYLIIFTVERWWPVFFVPVLLTLLCSLFEEKIFLKYLNEEDKALLEGRNPEEE